MSKIVITAQVEDAAKWEASYRTHGELLKGMTASSSHFTTTEDNEVVIFAEVGDIDTYMEILKSETTIKAMAEDGVKRETVKVYVLDKEFVF